MRETGEQEREFEHALRVYYVRCTTDIIIRGEEEIYTHEMPLHDQNQREVHSPGAWITRQDKFIDWTTN